MRAELLTVGSELTSGATVNTNAAYLARRLAEVGIRCARHVTVGDDRARVIGALREALRRCDLVVVTGGLGPTFDDITIDAIAHAAGCPLTYVPTAAATVRRFYAQHHRRLQRAALRQAYLPRGAIALPNPIGTAPGVWLSLGRQLVIALPGVPREMCAILERSVLPRLRRRATAAIETRTLRTVGVVELAIQGHLRRLAIPETIDVGLYPHLRAVDIRLTTAARTPAEARQRLTRVEARLRRALGRAVYGTGIETLEGAVGKLLARQYKTIAVAESCTGGLLCDRLTDVPGSSRYVRGGVMAYHNDLKRGCLGVPAATLAESGAVSAPVARAMAEGVRRLAQADVGVAITGIAGPTGGTRRKPVGLVYLGLADRRGRRSRRCHLFGDRAAIKAQAAQLTLDWLRRELLGSR